MSPVDPPVPAPPPAHPGRSTVVMAVVLIVAVVLVVAIGVGVGKYREHQADARFARCYELAQRADAMGWTTFQYDLAYPECAG